MDAFLRVIATELVALPSETVLITHEVGGLRVALGAVLDSVEGFAHRLFRRGAFLHDLGRIADQRRSVRPPESAGRGLAIGGLDDARGDWAWHQHRAVDIEGRGCA